MVTDPSKPDRKKLREISPAEPVIIAGRYRLENSLGQSSNAKVYRAIDLNNNYMVTLKLFFKRLERDPNFIALFRKEVRAAHKLNHPGILRTLDYGYDPQGYFLVNQYVEARNLQTLVKSQGKLDFAQVIAIMIPLCEALHYAHLQGVIHRDLKPQNVLIDSKGKTHLVDFGLARAVANTGLTITGHLLGSVGYLAPEQIQNTLLTPQTDMYALGVMMFEMVTGRLPFEGDADLLVALAHVRQTPPSPRQYNPKIPADLEAIIQRCLAKEPNQRYDSLPVLKAALQNCLESMASKTHHGNWPGLPHGGHRQAAPVHIPTPFNQHQPRSKKGLLVAGLLAGVTVIALLVIVLFGAGLFSQVKASITATPVNSTVPPLTTPVATTGNANPTVSSAPTTGDNGGSQVGLTPSPSGEPTTIPPAATTMQPVPSTAATTPEPTSVPTTAATTPPESPVADKGTPGGTPGKEIHWAFQDGPVQVDRNLVIGRDETLIIDPGVIVKMGPGANLTIAGGKLQAKGTVEQPVIFTSALPQPRPGSWGGLVISEGGEVVFSQVELNYAGSSLGWIPDPNHPALLVTDGRLEMTASKITYSGGPALVVRNRGRGFVTGSSFSQNANPEIFNGSEDFELSNNK